MNGRETFALRSDGTLVGVLIVGLWGPTGKQEWPGQFSVLRCTSGYFNRLEHLSINGETIPIEVKPGNWQEALEEYLTSYRQERSW